MCNNVFSMTDLTIKNKSNLITLAHWRTLTITTLAHWRGPHNHNPHSLAHNQECLQSIKYLLNLGN